MDEIIGVEYGYDKEVYANVARRRFDGTGPSILEENPAAFQSTESGFFNDIIKRPFYSMALKEEEKMLSSSLETLENNSDLSVVDLVNGYRPSLLAGEYREGEGQIVVSKNFADVLLQELGKEEGEYESLLGEAIPFGLATGASLEKKENYARETEDVMMMYSFPNRIVLKVTGVANLEPEDRKLVFFINGMGQNPFLKPYVKDREKLLLPYVHFYLRPGVDYSMVAKEIDEKLSGEHSNFIRYASSEVNTGKLPFESLGGFLPYFFGVVVLSLLLLPLTFVFHHKRNQKKRC